MTLHDIFCQFCRNFTPPLSLWKNICFFAASGGREKTSLSKEKNIAENTNNSKLTSQYLFSCFFDISSFSAFGRASKKHFSTKEVLKDD